MLGDSITITVNAVAKAMKKINQDSYSSEYLLRETTGEYRLKVRHSNEKTPQGGNPMDRHNVEFTRVVFGDGTTPSSTTVVSTTIRNPRNADAVVVDQLSDGLADWIKANGALLVGWES